MHRAKAVPTWSSLVLNSRPLIDHASLWLLFKPGTYVYAQRPAWYGSEPSPIFRSEPQDQHVEYLTWVVHSWTHEGKGTINKTNEADMMSDRYELIVWNVQHTGDAFPRIACKLRILRFEGYKSVLDLTVLPATLYDESDAGVLRHKLEERGQKTLSLLQETVSHREYSDPRHGYQGQIIVDAVAYGQYADVDDVVEGDEFSLAENVGIRFGDIVKATTNPPTNDPFLLLQGYRTLLQRRIGGFALKTKKWMVFDIDYRIKHPCSSRLR